MKTNPELIESVLSKIAILAAIGVTILMEVWP